MIQANELRIGNYVRANGPIMEVKAINKYNIELYLHGSEADNWDEEIENIEGIPLTPEILEKCGFISDKPNDEVNGFYNHPMTGKHIAIGYITQEDFFEFEFNYLVIKLKYLHQLQNLYFALTGEELQISL